MKKLEQELQGLVEGLASALARALTGAEIGELLRLGGARAGGERRGPGRPRKVQPVEKKPGRPKKMAKKEPKEKKDFGLNRQGEPKRWGRRKVAEVNELVEQVVEWVKKHETKEGVAAVDLAAGLRRSAGELVRPVQKALEEGKLRKTGERNQTRYFAV